MRVLVVNAGSSSVKLRLLDPDDTLVRDEDLPGSELSARGLRAFLRDAPAPDAVGHRVVHGGDRFTEPAVVDDGVERALDDLTSLAPLHQPPALAAIRVARRALQDLPQVACFDTAFHAALPPAAAAYALPRAWTARWPLRRFGFHGLSHAHAARRAAALLGHPAEDLRVVTCHLGAGASLAAVRGGRSLDTTMGFTPLSGLVMATRSGDVDPGLVLWLIQHGGLDPEKVTDGLEHRSGLAGLCGEADMRRVLARAGAGDADAGLALEVYLHRARAGVAAMAAALGGLDALVFTGGVGERAPAVREGIADGMAFLGLAVDRERNAAATGDADLSAPGAAVRTLVVKAREDLEIARGVREALRRAG